MIDAAVGEIRLIVSDQRDDVGTRNVSGRDDRELVPWEAAAVNDVFDEAAGRLAADGRAVKHSGKEEIVNVAGLSRDLGAPFLPKN